MSFGGAPVNVAAGETTNPGTNINEVQGGTLAANAGAFAVGAADSARMVTVNPAPAGTFQLPATFGPGRGNWTAADLASLDVNLHDMSALAAFSNVQLVTKSVAGGEITVDIHNKSATAAPAVVARLTYVHSGAR